MQSLKDSEIPLHHLDTVVTPHGEGGRGGTGHKKQGRYYSWKVCTFLLLLATI